MTLNEYQNIIEQTAVFPKTTDKFDSAYCTLGLVGEVGELVQAVYYQEDRETILKEAGDVYWYIAGIGASYGWLMEELLPEHSLDLYFQAQIDAICEALLMEMTKIAEHVKKTYRDAHLNQDKRLIDLRLNLIIVAAGVAGLLNAYNISLEECLEANYNKLMLRRDTDTLHGDGDNREEEE